MLSVLFPGRFHISSLQEVFDKSTAVTVSFVCILETKTFLRRKWQSVCRMKVVDRLVIALANVFSSPDASFNETASSFDCSWDTEAICEVGSDGGCCLLVKKWVY